MKKRPDWDEYFLKGILDLTESNPSRCKFQSLDRSLVKSLGKKENLEYRPEPKGLESSREAIQKYYQERRIKISSNQLFLTSSTSEAYSFLFRLLANAGDHVLFPTPSYPLFQFLVDINDLEMGTYSLKADDQWQIDFEDLEASITAKTKIIVLVNPNNPTGSYMKADELEKLNEICLQNRLCLLSDEVFWDYSFGPDNQGVSLMQNVTVPSFVLGGISKTLGLPQMKLSWIAMDGPTEFISEASQRLEIISDTYLSVNTPTQNALADWMQKRPKIQDEIRQRLNDNRARLISEIKNDEVLSLCHGEGGWYSILKIPSTYSEEEWVLKFLREDQVYVHPGYFFDFENQAHIVVSLLTPSDTFQKGIQKILKRINVS